MELSIQRATIFVSLVSESCVVKTPTNIRQQLAATSYWETFKRLRKTTQIKRLWFPSWRVVFIRDNARPHSAKLTNHLFVDVRMGHFWASSSLTKPCLTRLHLISKPERLGWLAICRNERFRVIFVHNFFVILTADACAEFTCDLIWCYDKYLGIEGILWKNRKFSQEIVEFFIFTVGCLLAICRRAGPYSLNVPRNMEISIKIFTFTSGFLDS